MRKPSPFLLALFSLCLLAHAPALADEPENGSQLDPLIVSAGLAPAPLSHTHASVSLITRQEIEESGFLFAGDLLRSLPGFSLAASGPTGAQQSVFLRGHESKHTLVLRDGLPLNKGGIAHDLAHITLDDVERVEVIRGRQSAIHGTAAIGGVINFISRRPTGKGQLHYEAGSFGSNQIQASFSSGEATHITASFGFYESDNIDVSAEGEDEKDAYRNHRASLRLGYDTPVGDFLLGGRYHDTQFNRDDYGVNGVLTDGAADNTNEDEEITLHAGWTVKSGAITHELSFDRVDNKLLDENGAFTENTFSRRQHTYRIGWGVEQGGVTGLFGYNREMVGSTSAQGVEEEMDEEYYFIAAEGKWEGVNMPDASLTVRRETDGRLEPTWVWQMTLGHELDDWHFYGSYGVATNNPSLAERYGNYGNPNLTREKSRGWEFGIARQFATGVQFNLIWFDDEVEHEIAFDNNNNVYINDDGVSRRDGLEASFLAPLSETLQLGMDLGWINSRDVQANDELRRPEQQMRFRVLWTHGDLKVNLILDGRSSRYDYDFVNGERVKLDPYNLVSLNASWQASDALSLYLRGENLLDEEYEDVVSYRTRGAGVFAGLRASY